MVTPELLPDMTTKEYDAFKADITEHGIKTPVVVDAETGELVARTANIAANAMLLAVIISPTQISKDFGTEYSQKGRRLSYP